MSDTLKLLIAILLCAQYVPAQTASTAGGAKAIVMTSSIESDIAGRKRISRHPSERPRFLRMTRQFIAS
jgi:hypothetical protein